MAWIPHRVHQEAERQWSGPAELRADLVDIQELRDTGAIDAAEADRLEEGLLQRLMAEQQPIETPDDSDERP